MWFLETEKNEVLQILIYFYLQILINFRTDNNWRNSKKIIFFYCCRKYQGKTKRKVKTKGYNSLWLYRTMIKGKVQFDCKNCIVFY